MQLTKVKSGGEKKTLEKINMIVLIGFYDMTNKIIDIICTNCFID